MTPPEEITQQPQQPAEEKKKRRRPGHPHPRPISKRHKQNLTKVDCDKEYPLEQAVAILKSTINTKFDETVEIVMKLGIDTKKSDQLVRGSVSLPKGIGKSVKVLAFAEGEAAEIAKKAGADVVGGKEIADKIINEGWLDFDVAIAHTPTMKFVGKLGKTLGPKGKMPSPKSGTVVEDVGKAVQEFKAGKVEFRADSGGNIHAPVGKKSFTAENLMTNIETFIEHIKHVRPATSKGTYVQKIVISTTMGPGVALEIKR